MVSKRQFATCASRYAGASVHVLHAIGDVGGTSHRVITAVLKPFKNADGGTMRALFDRVFRRVHFQNFDQSYVVCFTSEKGQAIRSTALRMAIRDPRFFRDDTLTTPQEGDRPD